MTNKRINFLLPLLLPAIAYLVFSNGLTGSFYYDDYRPLSGLLNVVDFNSAALYVTTETSGPLGRPISMLSFLLNIGDWPNNIEGFLVVNLVIHALNAVLAVPHWRRRTAPARPPPHVLAARTGPYANLSAGRATALRHCRACLHN